MFYFDYMIKNGFLYIFQETKDDRVFTQKVCHTTKTKVDGLWQDSKNIYVTI